MTTHDPHSGQSGSSQAPPAPACAPVGASASGPVRRRLVFYVAGYDPRGAGWYHGVYARESAKQAAINGMRIETGARQRVSPQVGPHVSRWTVRAHEASATNNQQHTIETQYDFLHWDDLVRETWARGVAQTIAQSLAASWYIFFHGFWWRLYCLSWPFAVTAAYPVLHTAGAALAGILAGWLFFTAAAWLAGGTGWAAWITAITAGLTVFAFLLDYAAKANVFWIGRILSIMVAFSRDRRPDVDARTRLLADHVVAARAAAEATGGVDEILFVGHSVGGDTATRVLARVLDREPDFAARGSAVAYLTLGQMIVCEAFPDGSPAIRADLLALATAPGLHWLDVAFPGDPACIALVDPLDATGIVRPPGALLSPKMLSPRFNKLFTPQTWARLRKQKMELHFSYLYASELPGDYDYFAITAGSRKLEERFAHLESIRDFDRLKRGIWRGRV